VLLARAVDLLVLEQVEGRLSVCNWVW